MIKEITPCNICNSTTKQVTGSCINVTHHHKISGNIEKRKNQIIRRSKKKAKMRGILFEITKEDLEWPLHCPVLGIELEYWTKKIHNDNTVSLDRLDSTKGYIPGNVVVISYRANRIKNDSTIDELRKLVTFMEINKF